jgi:hypothetical protein
MSFDLPDAIELKKITEYKTLTFIGRAYIFPLPLDFIYLQRQNNSE